MNKESIIRFLSASHYEDGGYVHTARKRFRFTNKWRIITSDVKAYFDTGTRFGTPIPLSHIRAFSTTRPRPDTPPRLPTNPKPLIH